MNRTDRPLHPQMVEGARTPRLAALLIALIYAAVGALWIWLSDALLNATTSHEIREKYHLQTMKGWLYIAITAAMLYWLIRRTFTAVRASAEGKRQTERRTKLLVDRVRDYAIFMIDLDGNVTSWNRGAQQIFDWPERDILGKNFAIFYTNSDIEAGKPQQHLAEARDLGWSEAEGMRLRQDGDKFRAVAQLTALRDEAGHLTGYLCVLRDVTERRRAQEAMQRMNQALTSVIETSPLPIITLDAATNVLAWNAAAEKMFGWSAEEVIGKPLPTIPDSEREDFRGILRAQSGGTRMQGKELIRRRKDGSLISVSIWTAPIFDGGGNMTGIIGIFADLSERKRAEESVRELNETLERRVQERTMRLEEANEELQAFSYTVSHDLRLPLRSMAQLASDLLTAHGSQLDEEGKVEALRLVGAAARMERQVEELLEYSRVSRTELKNEPVSLILIIHELLGRLERDKNFKEAQVSVQEPLGWVMGHRLTLQQVLLTLLTNALTFTRPGVTPVINIRSEESAGKIRLTIEDNGIGISAEDRDRIFHLFERLPAADQYPGAGVGLAVVRRGVERMGGRIELRSVPTGGTIFTIELPKAVTQNANSAARQD